MDEIIDSKLLDIIGLVLESRGSELLHKLSELRMSTQPSIAVETSCYLININSGM